MKRKLIETLQFKQPKDATLLFEIIDLSKPGIEIPSSYHRHEFYEIILILKGKTKQLVDFNTYNVNQKEVLIIPKGSIHQGDFKEKLNGFIILFTADFFTQEQGNLLTSFEIFNSSFNSNHLKFKNEDWLSLFQLFNILQQEYFHQSKTQNSNTLRFLFLAFATKLNDIMQLKYYSKAIQSSLLKSFFDLLDFNFKKQHSVNFYSTELNVTPKSLTQTLFNATGKNTLQLINDKLVLEAKRELSFSTKTIKEVSAELGFEDQLYFSKFFKKHTTTTPQDFKRKSA